MKKNADGWDQNQLALKRYEEKLATFETSQAFGRDLLIVVLLLLIFVVLLQLWVVFWPLIRRKPEPDFDVQVMASPVQAETQEGLKMLREASKSLSLAKSDLSAQFRPLSEVMPKLAKALADFSVQKDQLDDLQRQLAKSKDDLARSQSECAAAKAAVAPLVENNGLLTGEKESLRGLLTIAERNLDATRLERDSLLNSVGVLQSERDALSGDKSNLESELKSERASLSSASAALFEARNASETLGAKLEASFVRLAPTFLADSELASFIRKLHEESLAGSPSASAAWSTLTAFASAEADPAAKDFQLHVLKRLGTVLVHYWKEQPGSVPKDRHESLSQWARCLNEQAHGRFNLFVPAIGAPVDRTKMTTATTATIVQEVLCWQVRNPSGANYNLAEVA